MPINSKSDAYAAAGVDITAGYTAVEMMKEHIARTITQGVCSDVGGFGGLFELPAGYQQPVLVSGTDGVGTKLKLAFLLDKHNSVGIDCVAMCVNDIICAGATPLFFLDYIACGKNHPEKIAQIVAGVAEGCVQSGAALIGGETAEMPGFYPENEYDLAGFSVGIVDKEKIIDCTTMQTGDKIIALPSAGVHSNGFSLVRKVFDVENTDLSAPVAALGGKSLGEELLTPTKIYVRPILACSKKSMCAPFPILPAEGFMKTFRAPFQRGNVPVSRARIFGYYRFLIIFSAPVIFLKGICLTPLIWASVW